MAKAYIVFIKEETLDPSELAQYKSMVGRSFEGHEVQPASDGREALDLITARAPDAVILDVSMPVLDGLQACHRLRADGVLVPRASPLPVEADADALCSVQIRAAARPATATPVTDATNAPLRRGRGESICVCGC